MRPAIVVPVITQLVEETRAAIAAMNDADALAAAYEKKLGEQREIQKARRIEVGMLLKKARESLPARSRDGNGWMEFLGAVEIAETTAYRYMTEAGWVSGRALTPNVGNKESDERETPPPTDDDAPPELAGESPAPEVVIDRDTWCTPKEWAEALGDWELDPCSNERSHIQAAREFRLEERGEDGLVLASSVDAKARVFINPPYSDVMPWVKAYAHTRFCFLLKFDPSTKWFAELLEHTEIVLLPRGTRIQFEAPPGVPPEKSLANQFPHALFYARAKDATKAIRDLCFSPWSIR